MNNYLNIGQAAWSGKTIKLPEQSGTHQSDALFQQYLNKNRHDGIPLPLEKLTPDVLRTLAATLISALDRTSMNVLFFDSDSGSDTSLSGLLSTDLFMAMRNSATTATIPVPESPVDLTVQVSESAVIESEQQLKEQEVPSGSEGDMYAPLIASAAASYGLDPKLIEAVVRTESNFNTQAISPVGAQGLMQLMPATAAELGVTDAFDPEQNIKAGSKYLKQLMNRYNGDTGLVLAAYNWGMGNLERHPERMPQETVNYVAKITGLMNKAA